MHAIDTSTAPVRILRPTVTAAVLDDGAVLLDLESKYFYALNATGWAIVQLFESGTTVEQVAGLARDWGAPDDDRVVAFVAQLTDFGLLEGVDMPAPVSAIEPPGAWNAPTIERQPQPLQNVMVSAFDPSFPLGE